MLFWVAGSAAVVGRGPFCLFVLLVMLLGCSGGCAAALIARCAVLSRGRGLSAAAGLITAARLCKAHRTHQRECKYHR